MDYGKRFEVAEWEDENQRCWFCNEVLESHEWSCVDFPDGDTP